MRGEVAGSTRKAIHRWEPLKLILDKVRLSSDDVVLKPMPTYTEARRSSQSVVQSVVEAGGGRGKKEQCLANHPIFPQASEPRLV